MLSFFFFVYKTVCYLLVMFFKERFSFQSWFYVSKKKILRSSSSFDEGTLMHQHLLIFHYTLLFTGMISRAENIVFCIDELMKTDLLLLIYVVYILFLVLQDC